MRDGIFIVDGDGHVMDFPHRCYQKYLPEQYRRRMAFFPGGKPSAQNRVTPAMIARTSRLSRANHGCGSCHGCSAAGTGPCGCGASASSSAAAAPVGASSVAVTRQILGGAARAGH